ncbi:MAG: electron transfer flavoprotein-ubiquinone oxidoreductase, partial [Gammaproteobacteria bacterium]|nr:electron transfer flavoprotein-ubiquinone oxidoreductase [Gammaproteobacteria bacterium]
NGQPTSLYQPGMNLYAKQVFFAEGCRGSLTQTLFDKFNLRKKCDPQTYGLGIKELWEIPHELHQPGKVIHSIGWPLNQKTYGGSFIYYLEKNILAIGFVIGLDYQNPYLNPYKEFQRFKTHNIIRPLLEKSKRIAYGARALNEGGLQSIPKLTFPGGLIIGCAAGFLNVPKIKGIHTAMKSGMIAAECVISLLKQPSIRKFDNYSNQSDISECKDFIKQSNIAECPDHSKQFNVTKSDEYSKQVDVAECNDYSKQLEKSWVWKELTLARNIRPAMNWGLIPGLLYSAFDTYILKGKAPWTLHNHADYVQLKSANDSQPVDYVVETSKVAFDLMSSVFLTHSFHDENQPCHLKLKDPTVPVNINFKIYDGPEQRYCPAGVYEFLQSAINVPYLHINAANCIHCKACDIKDPMQNITWTPPEGGSGPQYEMM